MRLLLTSPVNIARQIVIQQTVDDRFLQVFTQQITINGVYTIPNGSEVCSIISISIIIIIITVIAFRTMFWMFSKITRSKINKTVFTITSNDSNNNVYC